MSEIRKLSPSFAYCSGENKLGGGGMKYCYQHARKASRSRSKDVIAKIDNVANCKHGSVVFLKANEVLAGSEIGQEIAQNRTTRGM